MEEYIGSAVIQDLPIEVMEMVLKKLDNCEQRNTMRLVCSTWLRILNQNSSIERFHATKNIKLAWIIPEDEVATILNVLQACDRRQICYDFRMNHLLKMKILSKFNSFFKEKGENITSLSISLHPFDVDSSELEIISKNCPNLETVRLQFHMVSSGSAKALLNDCDVRFHSVKKVIGQVISMEYLQLTTSETFTLVQGLLKVFPNSGCIEIYGQEGLGHFHQRFKYQPLNKNARIVIHEKKYNELNPMYHENTNVISYGNIALGERTIYNFLHLNVKMIKPDRIVHEPSDCVRCFSASETELLEFLINSPLLTLHINLQSWEDAINFPFKRNGQEIRLSKLNTLYINGGKVILDKSSNIYKQLEHLNLQCDVIHFDSIIHKLSNISHLKLQSVSYENYVTICDQLCNLKFLGIKKITGFNPCIIGKNLHNLAKLTKLKEVIIPVEVRDLEIFTEKSWQSFE